MDLSHDDFDSPDSRALSSAHIIAAWRERASRELPWCTMPPDDRLGELRPVIEAVLDLSEGLYDAERRRHIRLVASRHGAFRRAQACAERVVVDDFSLVRVGLKVALADLGVSNAPARQFIRTLLPDLRLARRVAVESYKTGAFGSSRR